MSEVHRRECVPERRVHPVPVRRDRQSGRVDEENHSYREHRFYPRYARRRCGRIARARRHGSVADGRPIPLGREGIAVQM